MEIKISDEFIDEIIEKIMYRFREIKDKPHCRRCDKRIGWEDEWCLCVACQVDIGDKKLKSLEKKK